MTKEQQTSADDPPEVWRYARYFIPIPWPLAFPDEYFFAASKNPDEHVYEHRVSAIHALFPNQPFANTFAETHSGNFVAFQFRRLPTSTYSYHQLFMTSYELANRYALDFPAGRLPSGIFSEDPTPSIPLIQTHATLVELTTCVRSDINSNFGLALQETFDLSLDELARFIGAYVQTTNDLQTGHVNRSTITRPVTIVLIEPETLRTEVTGITWDHQPDYRETVPETLTEAQLKEIVVRLRMAIEGEPYVAVAQWQRTALRAFRLDGDYSTAVVAVHTAGEVFFDALLLRMAWEDIYRNRTPQTITDVASFFTRSPTLASRLRRHFHTRLKGGWDPDKVDSPLREWESEVSRVRNRIVHGGYRPTEEEASAALKSLGIVANYVFSFISTEWNRAKYPLTVAMMLGGPEGLSRRNLYRGKIKEELDSAPTDWISEFYRFRRQVIDLIWNA